MKSFLKSVYPKFREAYKSISGVDPMLTLTCIGTTAFTDVVNALPGFIDGKNINLADLDLEFISTNSGGRGGARNPQNKLVRHNWMEVFVRLAVTRFVNKEKATKSPFEAVKLLYFNYLDAYFKKFNMPTWRKKVLH